MFDITDTNVNIRLRHGKPCLFNPPVSLSLHLPSTLSLSISASLLSLLSSLFLHHPLSLRSLFLLRPTNLPFCSIHNEELATLLSEFEATMIINRENDNLN